MKKIIGIFLLTGLLIGSCRNKEQLGPDLVANIIEPLAVSNSTVDFSTGGSVYFTAKFENDVIWTLNITAANGAKKIFTGTSKEINAENSTWTGTADVLPSFIAGAVTATLTFSSDPKTESVPVVVTAKRVSDLPGDVLVTNFVASPVQNYGGTIAAGNWPSTYPLTVNNQTIYGLPDGNAYEFMGDVKPWQGAGSPFVDIVSLAPRNSQINYGTFYPVNADPSKVYFNMMVYGTGTPVWLQINFFEVEALNHNSTTGNPSADRQLTIKPTWTGWKMVSVKYSDLVPLSTAATTDIHPDKITDIQIVLLSSISPSDPAMANTVVKTAFDHLTFTHNKPYQP